MTSVAQNTSLTIEPSHEERFWYPFTATTVIARRLVPLLLLTLGAGLFLWAGREFFYWLRPWAVLPELLLGLSSWAAAAYFFTLLPEVRADEHGLRVRRLGRLWRRIPWDAVAGVRETARIDLLGWAESFYTLFVWRTPAGRHGQVRRDWQRRRARGLRFSGHIRNCDRLLAIIHEHLPADSNPALMP